MNASIRGIMFTKADRIDERVDMCAKKFLNRYGDNITREDFKDFVKSIHVIVDTELTEKGVERKWKESSMKQENLKTVCSQATTKEHTSWLKTLMTKLQQCALKKTRQQPPRNV